jgi:ketosteroid isomerase-like protein
MAVAPEAEALLRRTYDAFNRKDIDTALAAAHPDVDWPNVLDGTRVVGLEEVRLFFERQLRVLDLHLEPLSMEEDEHGAIVVRLRQVMRFASDGALMADEVVQHIYTFRDGRVAKLDAREADGRPIAPQESELA